MAVFWLIFLAARRDLWRAMLWSGRYYIVLLSFGFIVYRLITHDVARTITPGYWTPPTLFDLGRLTGGYAIEDALFMFFIAGWAAALYKLCFNKKSGGRRNAHLKNRHTLKIGLLVALVVFLIFPLNALYLLIISSTAAAVGIMWQRPDLIRQGLWGGLLTMATYALFMLIFITLFPHFYSTYYHLHDTTHVMIFNKFPLEEYLYALSFGLWASNFYEYKNQLTLEDRSKLSKKSISS